MEARVIPPQYHLGLQIRVTALVGPMDYRCLGLFPAGSGVRFT